jgi:peptide/nickel transport system permease protein
VGIVRQVTRRFAALAVLLVVLSMAVFGLQYLAGGVEAAVLGDGPATPEALQAVRDKYHLNDPLPVQYGEWISRVATLDFGTSIRTRRPVLTDLVDHVQVSVVLVAYGFILTMAIGVVLGTIAALRQGHTTDKVIVAAAAVLASTPAFVASIFLIYVFAVLLRWFPAFGPGDDFPDQIRHLTLPAVALAMSAVALVVKLTRAELISVLKKDYVMFARARGVRPHRLMFVYILRNGLNPVLSATGLTFTRMLFGTVLVEVTFGLPGLGSLLVQTANTRDIFMMQALALLIGIVIVAVNLMVDIAYTAANPRIRLSM